MNVDKKSQQRASRGMSKGGKGVGPKRWNPDREDGNRCFPSDALFEGRQEIEIDHRGRRYALRITRQGKLILNKIEEHNHE
jgi:hypothetical protein